MPKYIEVENGEGLPERGIEMENLVEMTKDLESLKRQRLEDSH